MKALVFFDEKNSRIPVKVITGFPDENRAQAFHDYLIKQGKYLHNTWEIVASETH